MIYKSYSDLIKLNTFEERFGYLRFRNSIGEETFGFDRYLNQSFYGSKEWRSIRNKVILRDNGCDLAINDRQIFGKIMIHHLNPVTEKQIESRDGILFDMDNLICVSFDTHNAIHFGSENLLPSVSVERKKFDTCPWR